MGASLKETLPAHHSRLLPNKIGFSAVSFIYLEARNLNF